MYSFKVIKLKRILKNHIKQKHKMVYFNFLKIDLIISNYIIYTISLKLLVEIEIV